RNRSFSRPNRHISQLLQQLSHNRLRTSPFSADSTWKSTRHERGHRSVSQLRPDPLTGTPSPAPARPEAAPTGQGSEPVQAVREPSRLRVFLGTYEFGVTLSLVILIILVSLLTPRFLTTVNLMNVARNFAFNAA